ncbi:UNVERIFIED_CONTAM: Serine/arginine-rich splicing factor a [Sesamum radiatum]|uniref:Serine/arginine-rich splicing factor a n=1 Tax=Sesamum radiatum TaxID=300843 RepID=A0AAW2VLN5_SESRA
MADSPRKREHQDAVNPGNTLYVTGLSTRVTERDLEDHFSKEGKVIVVIVVDIVEAPAVTIMATGGLLGVHLIGGDVITLLDSHHLVEGQEGTGPGPIRLDVVLKGTMHVVLGENVPLE